MQLQGGRGRESNQTKWLLFPSQSTPFQESAVLKGHEESTQVLFKVTFNLEHNYQARFITKITQHWLRTNEAQLFSLLYFSSAGEGGEERKVPKREIKRDGRTEGKEEQERWKRGEYMNGKKDRKAFYARESTQRKLTELAKKCPTFQKQ